MWLTPTAAVWFGWCARLGLTAYVRLAEKFSDPFLSCPLKAVIRYELAKQGHTLRVHGCATNVAQDLLESWKAVVQGMRFLTAKASA